MTKSSLTCTGRLSAAPHERADEPIAAHDDRSGMLADADLTDPRRPWSKSSIPDAWLSVPRSTGISQAGPRPWGSVHTADYQHAGTRQQLNDQVWRAGPRGRARDNSFPA